MACKNLLTFNIDPVIILLHSPIQVEIFHFQKEGMLMNDCSRNLKLHFCVLVLCGNLRKVDY